MERNQLPADEKIERAAERKAQGWSWEQIAAELGYPPEIVRGWTTRYRAKWRRALREAERVVAIEGGSEAIFRLRKQVRTEDGSEGRLAAQALLRHRIDLEKLDLQRRRLSRPPQTAQGYVVSDYMKGMTDERYLDLLGGSSSGDETSD
jgi:hypothetical protein